MFSFSEAAVIISRESGSRTIVYNPGNQEPLNASEFALAFERSQSSFHWIHFEARPFVHDMLSYLSSKDKEVSSSVKTEPKHGSARLAMPSKKLGSARLAISCKKAQFSWGT